ncbi:MAG: damage-control phosphatase ARMT1 family protein [bacterium]
MENTVECIPCYLGLILNVLEEQRVSDEIKKQVMRFALEEGQRILDGGSTPTVMKNVTAELNRLAGDHDPYKKFKQASTQAALKIYPNLKKIVTESPDPFARAVEFAVAGNSIDLVDITESDLSGIIEWMEKLDDSDFAVNHIEQLEAEIKSASTILYIGDNAGETVFDRLVLNLIDVDELYYGVRGGPVLNDSTEADALEAGVDSEAQIISSGIPAPGTLLDEVNREFLEIFHAADLVIAKGQGNFESLQDIPRPVYHLFKAKCTLVARQVGCKTGDFIVWKRSPDKSSS